MAPAPSNITIGALAFSPKTSIKKDSAGTPAKDHSSKLCYPATVTPIKLTRSLPAKAMAKEKVPARTINLSGFNEKVRCIMNVAIVQKRALLSRMISVCSAIKDLVSVLIKLAPFNPLINRKYVMAVIAIPPKTAPYFFRPAFRLNVKVDG